MTVLVKYLSYSALVITSFISCSGNDQNDLNRSEEFPFNNSTLAADNISENIEESWDSLAIPQEQSIVFDVSHRSEFHLREGNYIPVRDQFKREDYVTVQSIDDEHGEIERYVFSVVSSLLTEKQKKLLNRKVFLGDESELLNEGKTLKYYTVYEKLTESLPGIQTEASEFEPSYSWEGGMDTITDDHGLLFCSSEEDEYVSSGQWAFIADSKPLVFTQTSGKDESADENLSNDIYNEEEIHQLEFSSNDRKLLVTYRNYEECGEIFEENIILWEITPNGKIELEKLKDLPALIMDLDLDGDIDILYKETLDFNPEHYIDLNSPDYKIYDGDTVFVGCGC